jgi:hypothetical protein
LPRPRCRGEGHIRVMWGISYHVGTSYRYAYAGAYNMWGHALSRWCHHPL